MNTIEKSKIPKPNPMVIAQIHSLKTMKGKIAAVEPKSGKWFVGNTVLEAIKKARAMFPDNIFYILRIGYKVAGTMKSGKVNN